MAEILWPIFQEVFEMFLWQKETTQLYGVEAFGINLDETQ